MKYGSKLTRPAVATAGLERIRALEEQFTAAGVNSRARRALREAIRIEAGVYRKSLDAEQARAFHDERPWIVPGPPSVGRPVARHHR